MSTGTAGTSHFDRVVLSAVDFMEAAISDLNPPGDDGKGWMNYPTSVLRKGQRPKYSLVNFCTAVELFLKARLLKEHWTLVVDNPGNAERTAFEAGRLKTAMIDQVMDRLEKIARDPLTRKERETFRKLADHRNGVIHFFDSRYAEASADEEATREVIQEQCQAWFHLHGLLTGRWAKHFDTYKKDIGRLASKMHGVRSFLDVKIAELKDTIARERAAGVFFERCFLCSTETVRYEPIEPPLYHCTCVVCNVPWGPGLRVACRCSALVTVRGTDGAKCPACSATLDVDFVLTAVRDAPGEAAFCFSCADDDDRPTVVPFRGRYLCVGCFESRDAVGPCSRCSKRISGFEDLGLCAFCDRESDEDDLGDVTTTRNEE